MITLYIPDALRASVEAATNNNLTVIYDEYGYPSVMKPLYPDSWASCQYIGQNGADVDQITKTTKLANWHRAFLADATTQYSEIFVGVYPASIVNGNAVSLPNKAPACNLSYLEASGISLGKGDGWHIMNNWEYSYIVQKFQNNSNGYIPYGNDKWGTSAYQMNLYGTRVDGRINTQVAPPLGTVTIPQQNGTTYTGSGPSDWNLGGEYNGLSDLVGNVYEFVDGVQLLADSTATNSNIKIMMSLYNGGPLVDTSCRITNYLADTISVTQYPMIYHTSQGGFSSYVNSGTTIVNPGPFLNFASGLNSGFLTLKRTIQADTTAGQHDDHGVLLMSEGLIYNLDASGTSDLMNNGPLQMGTVHFNLNRPINPYNGQPSPIGLMRGGSWKSMPNSTSNNDPDLGIAGLFHLNFCFDTIHAPDDPFNATYMNTNSYYTQSPGVINNKFSNCYGFRVCKYGTKVPRTDSPPTVTP